MYATYPNTKYSTYINTLIHTNGALVSLLEEFLFFFGGLTAKANYKKNFEKT